MAQSNRLSNREREVLKLLLQGKSNKLIASSLGISGRTVEFHLKNIYVKFQVSSRIELILKLGNTTGKAEMEKLGYSTVDSLGESTDNRDKVHSDTASIIGKELEMKNLLNTKHVLVGVITALFTGFSWVTMLISTRSLFLNEVRAWIVPLIVIWAMIGLSVGMIGKQAGNTLSKVFFGALLGTGLSPFAIIPLMMIFVLPLGKLAAWFGWIDPSTMPGEVATMLSTIAMIVIWLVVGITIGTTFLFVIIKKPEQAGMHRRSSEHSL